MNNAQTPEILFDHVANAYPEEDARTSISCAVNKFINVTLVATLEAIKMHFPEEYREPRLHSKPGIMSAEFSVALDECQTKLGLWLAQNISSTRHDDDGSSCSIVIPATEQGLQLQELGTKLINQSELRTREEFEQTLEHLESWIGRQRARARMAGESYLAYRVIDFDWPVFGSARSNYASTPAAYFDECGKQIRQTGGVIISAGLSRSAPPSSLLQTMGPATPPGGQTLFARYRESLAERVGVL